MTLREVVDEYGQPNHECGAAVSISHARWSVSVWEDGDDAQGVPPGDSYFLGDAICKYERALRIASICDECRAEAHSVLRDLVAEAEALADARRAEAA